MEKNLLILFSFVLLLWSPVLAANTRCAFATFVNTEDQDSVYSAVSLGKSIVNTEGVASRIAVLYGPYSLFTNRILQLAGWTIVDSTTHYVLERDPDDPSITAISTGNRGREALMAKFFVFTLTDYDVVVYLDNNVIVASNIDELCSCSFAKMGSVTQSRNHDIGVMTFIPSKEMFATLATAISAGFVNEPYDIFDYLYKSNACPYYDPLSEDPKNGPSTECIRLPARYNGDVAYHLLEGFVDSHLEIDKPKVLYYSLNGIKPWCWWNSILLPQYWIWSSGYMKAIDDARISFNFTTLEWIGRFSITLVAFYILPISRITNVARLFSNLYVNERHATVPFSKLLLFHLCNALFIFFGNLWSNVYVSHPVMNMVLYVFTMEGMYNALLFSHITNPVKRIRTRVAYLVGTYVFLVLFLNTSIMPLDFLFRGLLINSYFIFVHAISFSYLFVVNSHSLYIKLPQNRSGSSSVSSIPPSEKKQNPVVAAFHELFASTYVTPPHAQQEP
jgi:hypothetical protein